MKKRFLAFLLAVCVAVSMLVLPASAVGSNAAVQTATALGGLTAEQAGSLGAPLTRGQAARLLTAFSAYRDTTTAQGRTGRLYSDVDSDSPYAVYIRLLRRQLPPGQHRHAGRSLHHGAAPAGL